VRFLSSSDKNHPGVLDMDLKVVAEIIVKELENFELDFGNIPDYEEAVVKDSIFSEAWLATFMLATKSKDAMKYLESRDVPMQVIARMDIRFDPIQRRIGFPFRNAAGLVLGVQGRAINDDNPLRYYQYGYNGKRNAHAWLGEHWMDLDEPLVLVEGPFDVAKVMQVYGNVVASFTAGISVTKLKRIRDASEIITFYDFGKGGEAARSKIHQVMGKKVIADLIPTEEEDDPGNTPIDKIKEMLENYVSLE
jgi:5S rRNA maturation endonuclease (ribonuclease M5)